MKKFLTSDFLPLAVAALMGPLFVFPRAGWMWALLGVPILWLGSVLLRRKWFRATPLDGAIAVLVLWAMFSTLGAVDIEGSVAKAAGFVYGIVVFYAFAAAAKTEERIKLGIAAFLAAGVVIAVVGTLSRPAVESARGIDSNKVFSLLPRVDLNIERAEEGVNPNPLGGTLILFIPLGLAMIPGAARKTFLLFFIAAVSICIAAVIFGRSFGAWAALVFSLLILGRKKRWIKAAVGAAVIAMIAIFWVRVDRPVSPNDRSLQGILANSVSSRFPLWAAGIAAVTERPVFGVGFDQLRLREGMRYEVAHAHNQFIHTAAELGIPGLAAYLAILFGAGWMTVRIERSKKPRWMKDAAQGLMVGQVGLAVFGLADAIALGAKPGVFIWVSLALIAAIFLAEDAKNETEPACS